MNAKRAEQSAAVRFVTPLASHFVTASNQRDAKGFSPVHLTGIQKPCPFSQYADSNFPERPLFGSTHQHTSGSMDGGGGGSCGFADREGVRLRPKKGSGFRARISTNLQRPKP